jgi:hypothetical protein
MRYGSPRLSSPVLLFASFSFCWGCDILSTDCSSGDIPSDQAHRVTISQGAWGQVWLWRGNFNPSYGCGGGKVKPVERLILIHDVALWPSDVVISDSHPGHGFFSEVRTLVIDSVQSDPAGFFEIALPAGRYSLFVREDSLFYAKSWAPGRPIGLVEVPEDGVHRVQFDINYQAAF